MTKKEMDLLEKVFGMEIEGRIYQGQNKTAERLLEGGFITKYERKEKTSLGPMTVRGYVLTPLGHITYCQSDRCSEVPV
jgi:hypothetical protein